VGVSDRGRTTAAITCGVRVGILNQIHIYVNVPDDGFRRQRVFFVLVDRLVKTLGSGIYVGEESGIVSVGRVKAAGELRLVKGM